MKNTIVALLSVLVIMTSVIAVVLFLQTGFGSTKAISDAWIPNPIQEGEPPESASIVIRRLTVGGLLVQPTTTLRNDGRMYLQTSKGTFSIEVPEYNYGLITHTIQNNISTTEDVLAETTFLKGCASVVDGIDELWLFVKEDGTEIETACYHTVDKENLAIREFEFFARKLSEDLRLQLNIPPGAFL